MWRLGSGQECSTDSMETSREFMSWMSTGERKQAQSIFTLAEINRVEFKGWSCKSWVKQADKLTTVHTIKRSLNKKTRIKGFKMF